MLRWFPYSWYFVPHFMGWGIDLRTPGGWLTLTWRPDHALTWSPDGTPMHERAVRFYGPPLRHQG